MIGQILFTVSQPAPTLVNPLVGGLPSPTPAGFQAGGLAGECSYEPWGDTLAPLPDVNWNKDKTGMCTAEPVACQVEMDGSSRVVMTPITILRNGRLVLEIGGRLYVLHHMAIYDTPNSHISRYEYLPELPGSISLTVYVDNRITVHIWDCINEVAQDLYGMYENLMDGLELDPFRKMAFFRSQASAITFRRLFPDYTCFALAAAE